MDASSLARDLDNLEKSWSSLDWWLNFWTILVVIGVAVELLVIVTEFVNDWRDFKRGIIHSPEKPSRLVFGLGLLGAALVASGVAGEFRMHIKAGKIETEMRDDTRQLVAIAQGEAANAGTIASNAGLETERLRRENLELREKIADRHLSLAQRRAIGNKLLKFEPQGWQIVTFSGDGEAKGFSTDIEASLVGESGAKWPPPRRSEDQTSLPIRGVLIEFGTGANSRTLAAAKALANALRAEGVTEVDGPKPFFRLRQMEPRSGAYQEYSIPLVPNPYVPITVIIGRKP